MSYDILIVDDQADIRDLLSKVLIDEGYAARTAANSHDALQAINQRRPHLIILDIWLNNSRFDGIEILDIIKQQFPYIPVVMISGHANIETAVKSLKKGAYDFIEKPFKTDRLLSIIAKGIESAKLQRQVAELRKHMDISHEFKGNSQKAEELRTAIHKIAGTNSRVMLTGPIGVGKELIARLIHENSPRKDHPFIVINCAEMNEKSFEEKLFGSETTDKSSVALIQPGLLEMAEGGTLFLSHVADIPFKSQSKLLKFLQDKTFQRVGGRDIIEANVRVLSSNPTDFQDKINHKEFREDLFYRLNVISFDIPNLSQRCEDIPVLCDYFMGLLSERDGFSKPAISREAMLILQAYMWPGNVLQLRNVMEWILIMAPSNVQEITKEMLPPELTMTKQTPFNHDLTTIDQYITYPLKEAREYFERDYLAFHIRRYNGNVSKTAQEIGMERTALHRKIKLLNLEPGQHLKIVKG